MPASQEGKRRGKRMRRKRKRSSMQHMSAYDTSRQRGIFAGWKLPKITRKHKGKVKGD